MGGIKIVPYDFLMIIMENFAQIQLFRSRLLLSLIRHYLGVHKSGLIGFNPTHLGSKNDNTTLKTTRMVKKRTVFLL